MIHSERPPPHCLSHPTTARQSHASLIPASNSPKMIRLNSPPPPSCIHRHTPSQHPPPPRSLTPHGSTPTPPTHPPAPSCWAQSAVQQGAPGKPASNPQPCAVCGPHTRIVRPCPSTRAEFVPCGPRRGCRAPLLLCRRGPSGSARGGYHPPWRGPVAVAIKQKGQERRGFIPKSPGDSPGCVNTKSASSQCINPSKICVYGV